MKNVISRTICEAGTTEGGESGSACPANGGLSAMSVASWGLVWIVMDY